MRPRGALRLLLWAWAGAGAAEEATPRPPLASPALTAEELHKELAELRAPELVGGGRRLAGPRRLGGEEEAEQVHLGVGGPGEVVVTYLAQRRGLASEVFFAKLGMELPPEGIQGLVTTYASYICPRDKLKHPALGTSPAVPAEELARLVNTSAFLPMNASAYFKLEHVSEAWEALERSCIFYDNPLGYHQSPYVHTVVLKGLEPRTSYQYRLGLAGREFTFTTPPSSGSSEPDKPFRLGVWADVGITNVSLAVMKTLLALEPELLLLVGDYAYADGWAARWDLFGQLTEPLMSKTATLGVAGDHEMYHGSNQGRDWLERYPVPFRPSGSESPYWYSYEAGLVHFLCIMGGYAPTGADSPQYQFVVQDLLRVNRTRTPWLVVQFHVPWYNSNTKHQGEGYKHRQDMEELFFFHGVDLIFNGHVHSYERSHPVYKEKVNRCGPVSIVVGDAGNFEGPNRFWREPRPAWSAFREASFGAGLLTVHNGTHAEWAWTRTACVNASSAMDHEEHYTWNGMSGPEDGPPCSTAGDTSSSRFAASDSATIVRDPVACPSRLAGSGEGWPAQGAGDAGRPAAFTERRLAAGGPGQRPKEPARQPPAAPGRRPAAPGRRPAPSPAAGVTRSLPRPPPSRPLSHDEALELAGLAAGAGREARRLQAQDPVQEVHLGLGNPGEAVVTFATWTRNLSSEVWYSEGAEPPPDGLGTKTAAGEVATYTTVICPSGHALRNSQMGPRHPVSAEDLALRVNSSAVVPKSSWSYTYLATASQAWDHLVDGCIGYTNPLGYYQSPYIHTALLTGLKPRTTYSYGPKASSRHFAFRTPPAPGALSEQPRGNEPFKIGVWADVGLTNISWASMKQVKDADTELVLLVGDYSYADGWGARWDIFGTLMEPLMASVATLGVPGNHEIASGVLQGVDWRFRYPVPFRESGSDSPLWYSYDSGPVHVLGLVGTYAPTGPESAQYHYAAEDLARVDRARTPWLVVQFHTPWYNSNKNHHECGYKHQQDMEDLFYLYGVDFVFNGHIHSYERSHPVFKNKVDPCGTVHVVVGDAGNYEGPTLPWIEPQPPWSAVRESSFGSGVLTVFNATHAEWAWRRVACVQQGEPNSGKPWWYASSLHGNVSCSTEGDNSQQASFQSDVIVVVRDVAACPNHAMPGAPDASWWSWALIGCALFLAAAGVTILLVMSASRSLRKQKRSNLVSDEESDTELTSLGRD